MRLSESRELMVGDWELSGPLRRDYALRSSGGSMNPDPGSRGPHVVVRTIERTPLNINDQLAPIGTPPSTRRLGVEATPAARSCRSNRVCVSPEPQSQR